MMRLLTRTSVLVLLGVVGTPAWAQSPAADPAPTRAAAVAGAPALRVVVQATEAQLDPYAVQRAIENELGVVVRGDAHQDVVGTLNVVATGPDPLTMEYVGNDGRRNSRTVKLPVEPAKRIETVALVAGNLARDETGELIEELRPPPKSVTENGDNAAAEPDAAAPAAAPPAAPAPAASEKAPPPSEPERAAAPAAATPELEFVPVNLSLFRPISIYPNSHELAVGAELGLAYSDLGQVKGGAVTLFVQRVRYGFQGARVAGLVNLTSGDSQGALVSGLAALQQGDLVGGSVSGLATLQRGDLAGGSVSGFGSYSEGNLEGAEVAGAVSFRRGDATGVQLSGAFSAAHEVVGGQIAGAFNLARETTGFQLSGASNATGSATGLMLTGGLNLATESVSGVQIAPFNVAQFINGLQLGVVNVARRVDGVQLGVVNIAEEVDGASVGIIPVAGNGYQRFVAWSTPGLASMNVAGKFGIGPVYTLAGVGYNQVDGDDRFLPTFGVGAQWEIGPVQLSVDGVYQTLEPTTVSDEQNADEEEPGADEWFVSLRPLVGVRVMPWLRLFGGPAVVAGPHDNHWNEEVKVRAVGGVEVFR